MSYYIPISAIIIGYMVHIDCQSINICANPENGQSCTLTCNTTDFSQTVQFLLGGAVQGSCTVFGSVSSCGSGLSQSGTITTYTIAALSRGTHEGDWSCKFGTATSSPVPLVVNTVPSVVNIIQTIPEVNSTEPTDKVKVSAECYCIYPFTSVIDVFNSEGVSGTSKQIATVDSGSIISNVNIGPPCLSDEYKIEISNFTVEPDISGSNVYIEIQFGSYKTAKYGPLNIAVAPGTEDKCPLFLYAFLPVLLITLLGTIIVIVVACYTDKDGKLKEGSMNKSCDCCPSDNKFCMAVCPLYTDPLCKGSKESVTMKNVASVVVLTVLAAVIGIIIAFGLGLESGMCILALVLSIVCGVVLVVIFIVSVYPHWPCVPEKGENAGESGNQDSPKKDIQRSSTAASTSKIHVTTEYVNMPREGVTLEGKTPRPLPAIGNAESTLEKKEKGTPLPEIPKSNKLPPVQMSPVQTTEDPGNEEEREKKRRKKKKKKREEAENEEDDKRDSQNSRGQTNVAMEEEE
ncbi:uncharacterized protein LOC125678769 isoform X3 [Ostrea edulis]|uniref:uncharacterized protein LOC125678769 isoform X3 n=1 Tax=Ostrea edulis TaxID=37623 RepID=UPI0024AF9941|nr:uncharacterized protein LOC125678769 isoform X3 [Ostrea edulis]